MKNTDCLWHREAVFLPVSLDLCLNRCDGAHGVVLDQSEIFNREFVFFHQVEHTKVSKDVNFRAADTISLCLRYGLVKFPFFQCEGESHFSYFSPGFSSPALRFNGSFRFALLGTINQRNHASNTCTQHNATCDSCKIHVEPPLVLLIGGSQIITRGRFGTR